MGNSSEGNPAGDNLLGGNLPRVQFLGLYFPGGRYYTGGNTLGRNHQGDNLLEENFSRGQFSERQSSRNCWGAIHYRETNPGGSLLRSNLLEGGQFFSGCNSLCTLFPLT